jgi:hypothetical protein
MSKPEETELTVQATAEPINELYYEVETLNMSGTFTNCNIYINAGSPIPPPPPPPPPTN